MATAGGPNIERDGLIFGMDTSYGIDTNSISSRFYPGEPTTNHVTTNLETVGTDGSGQSSIGTRTTIAPNHVKIVDINSNTRQTHLISGLTGGTIYTVSIQFKKIEGTPTFRFQLQDYNGGSYLRTIKFTTTAETGLEDRYGWQTASWTFTLGSDANALRIWWQDGADYTTYTHSFELKNPQLEAKNHVTPYISGTRSSTQSLIDLTKTTDIDVSNVSFDSTGQPTFDGTDDIIELDVDDWIRTKSVLSFEGVFYLSADTYGAPWGILTATSPSGDADGFWWHVRYPALSNSLLFRVEDSGGEHGYSRTELFQLNKWYHVVTVVGNDMVKIYSNGELLTSSTPTFQWSNINSDTATLTIAKSWTARMAGNIPIFKLYDRELAAQEVQQNYNAYKNRFNL